MENQRIFIMDHGKLNRIEFAEVLFIEALRNNCRLVTEKQEYKVCLPLGKIEDLLPDQKFIRIHRSFTINLDKVDSISKQLDLLSIKSYTLPISRRKKSEIITRINVLS